MMTVAIALGVDGQCGDEDNLRRRKGERFRTVQQVERAVRISGDRARNSNLRRGAQDCGDRDLVFECRGDAAQSRSAAKPPGRPARTQPPLSFLAGTPRQPHTAE